MRTVTRRLVLPVVVALAASTAACASGEAQGGAAGDGSAGGASGGRMSGTLTVFAAASLKKPFGMYIQRQTQPTATSEVT